MINKYILGKFIHQLCIERINALCPLYLLQVASRDLNLGSQGITFLTSLELRGQPRVAVIKALQETQASELVGYLNVFEVTFSCVQDHGSKF